MVRLRDGSRRVTGMVLIPFAVEVVGKKEPCKLSDWIYPS